MKKNHLLNFLFFAALFYTLILSTGCATMKGWFGMGNNEPSLKALQVNRAPRFSDNNNYVNPSQRQYKKMTRSRMEEESELQASAGSMWVMEGQGSYLFAQNKARREGDVMNIKIEGSAQKQVETKVSVIKKLLKQLEDEQQKQKEMEEAKNNPQLADAQNTGGAAAANPDQKRAPAALAKPTPEAEEKEEPLKIELVSTKIIERLSDGNYRLRGQQPFMIGKREYKVLVTGMIRPEDFNEDGVSSNKLLDPQFDVVSLRRTEKQ